MLSKLTSTCLSFAKELTFRNWASRGLSALVRVAAALACGWRATTTPTSLRGQQKRHFRQSPTHVSVSGRFQGDGREPCLARTGIELAGATTGPAIGLAQTLVHPVTALVFEDEPATRDTMRRGPGRRLHRR
jgi:hypothetical protein